MLTEKFHEEQPLPDDEPMQELCRVLSNFSITLNEFSMKRPPKLQVRVEKDPMY